MKKTQFADYALFPVVILYGILIGAIVYSHIAFIPIYLSDLPNSAVVVNGKYGINEAPFWMTIHPFLILSLVISLVSNWSFKKRRNLIAFSLGIYVAILITTAAYFVPELLAFAKSGESNLPAQQWLERGHRWQFFSTIRGAICFIGFVPLLIAFSNSEKSLPDFCGENSPLNS